MEIILQSVTIIFTTIVSLVILITIRVIFLKSSIKKRELLLEKDIEERWNNKSLDNISKYYENILIDIKELGNTNVIFIDESIHLLEDFSIIYCKNRFDNIISFDLRTYRTQKTLDKLIIDLLSRIGILNYSKIVQTNLEKQLIQNCGIEINDLPDDLDKYQYTKIIRAKCREKNIGILLKNISDLNTSFSKDSLLYALLNNNDSIISTSYEYNDKIESLRKVSKLYKVPLVDYFHYVVRLSSKTVNVDYLGSKYCSLDNILDDIQNENVFNRIYKESTRKLYYDSFSAHTLGVFNDKEILDFAKSFPTNRNGSFLDSFSFKETVKEKVLNKIQSFSNEQIDVLYLISKIPVSIYYLDLVSFFEKKRYRLSLLNDLKYSSLTFETNKFRYVNALLELSLQIQIDALKAARIFLSNENFKQYNEISKKGDIHLYTKNSYKWSEQYDTMPFYTKLLIDESLRNRFRKNNGIYANEEIGKIIEKENLLTNKEILPEFIEHLSITSINENIGELKSIVFWLKKYFNLPATITAADINEAFINKEPETITYYSVLQRKMYKVSVSSPYLYYNDYLIIDRINKTGLTNVFYSIAYGANNHSIIFEPL